MLSARLASVVMMRFYTAYLSTADYGVLELTELSFYVVTVLVGMGLATDALYYFLARCQTEEERASLLWTLLTAFTVAGLVGAGGVYVFAEEVSTLTFGSAAYAHVVRLFSITFAASTPVEMSFSYLRARNRAQRFLVFSLVRMFLQIGLNVVLLAWVKMGLAGMLTSSAIASGVTLCLMMTGTVRELGWPRRVDFAMLKRVAKYSAPLGLGVVGLLVVNYGDRFFLRNYCSLSAIGLYAVGYKFGMLLGMVNDPLKMFWRSQAHVVLKDGTADSDRVFAGMFAFSGVTSMLTWYLLAVLSEPALMLTAQRPFWGAAVYVPWVGLAYLLREMAFQFESSLVVDNHPRWVLVSNWCSAAVCLAGYALLIPRFGTWGAVLATVIAFLAMFTISASVAQRLHPRRLPVGKLVTVAATLGACFAGHQLAPAASQPWMRVAVAVGFALLGPAALWMLPPLREEREMACALGRTVAARFR